MGLLLPRRRASFQRSLGLLRCASFSGLVLVLFLPMAAASQALVPFQAAADGGPRPALWGYRDGAGRTVIAPQYRRAQRFRGPYAVVASPDGYGVINQHNQVLIPLQYHLVDSVAPDRFCVGYRARSFGEYTSGVVTAAHEVVLPVLYRFITFRANCYLVATQRDSLLTEGPFRGAKAMIVRYGLFTAQGQPLLPCHYESLRWLDDTLLVATTHSHNTLFSRTGQALTTAPYTSIGAFQDGVARVWLNQRCGFINRQGAVAIPVRFDFCEDFDRGVALVRVRQRWGAITRTGHAVIAPRYSYEQVTAKLRARGER